MLSFFLLPSRLSIAEVSPRHISTRGRPRLISAPDQFQGRLYGGVQVARVPAGCFKYAASKSIGRGGGSFHRQIASWFLWPPPRSTTIVSSRDALRCEAHRIVHWRAAGLPAPRLLALGENFILTADAGPTFIRWLAVEPRTCRRLELIEIAAQTLGHVHGVGFCHGRPMLSDIAFDGMHVTFLNLEETSAAVMPLATAQARDTLCFLLSAAGVFPLPWIRYCLRVLWVAYLRGRPPATTVRAIRRNLRLLRWISLPLRLIPRRWLRRDTARVLRALASAD